MKQFNLEEAKKGHKVCTRAGLPARIICFDACNETFPIVALISSFSSVDEEIPASYTAEGEFYSYRDSDFDLVLATEKNEGWINLYRGSDGITVPGCLIHQNKEKAIKNSISSKNRVDTIKIEWED